MALIHSPFGQADIVKKNVDRIAELSNESLAVEKGFRDFIENGKALAKKYKADIDVFDELPYRLDELEKFFDYKNLLWATREAATTVASRLDIFVNVFLLMAEEIDGPEARDAVVAELKNFAIDTGPFPLKGFPGATKKFEEIWSISVSDANNIATVLAKATDIPKTVKELKKDFIPIKAGYRKVQEGLKEYATHINL